MLEPGKEEPYDSEISNNQAVVTKPVTLLQLRNRTSEACKVLYIVSPSYVYLRDKNSRIVYDDSIIIDYNWSELKDMRWNPSEF